MIKIPVSIGVFAYNEEKTIGLLLTKLINQKTELIKIDEIIVVSSGSFDKTNSIVQRLSRVDNRIILKAEKKRTGKVSAINIFLRNSKNKIVILESGDTIPAEDSIEKLCLQFQDKIVGMVASRPIPINSQDTFMGFTTHFIWNLHHLISLKNTKCGELIAFRKEFNTIPIDTYVDEAWIEYEISRKGYEIVYAPNAIVYNKGPETISDFIKQRRRIAAGHLDLKKKTNYRVSTSNQLIILKSIIRLIPKYNIKKIFWILSTIGLESISNFIGFLDYNFKKDKHKIWNISQTARGINNNIPKD